MGCGTSRKIEKENRELTSKGMPISRKKLMDFVVRKEINDLSHQDFIRFFDAVRTMMHNREGKIGSSEFFRIAGYPGWPNYHAQMGTETFAIWHRMLLVEFEQALQKADKLNGNDGKISLPYWDWANNTFPIQVYDLYREFPKSFFPENDPNSEEFQQVMFSKRRSPQEISDYIKASRAPELAQQALSTGEYWKFSSTRWRGVGASVEAANNAIHMACGYPMTSMKYAAFDILYWFHHCNVDRYFTKYLHQDFDAYQEFYNSQKIISELKDLKNIATLPLEPFRHPQSNKHALPRDCFEDTKTMGYLYDVLPPKPSLQLEQTETPFNALFEGIQVKALNGKSYMLHVFAIENDDNEFELPDSFEKIINSPNYAGFTSVISGLNYWKQIGKKDDSQVLEYEPINASVDITNVIKRMKLSTEKVALKVVCEDEYGQYFKIEDVQVINLPRVIGPFFENNDKDISKTNARENYNIQKYLQALGYYQGNKDGVLGEQSMHAIREFQKSMGIQSDGVLGVRTKEFFNRPRHDLVRDFEAKTSKYAQIVEKFNFKEAKFWLAVQPGYLIREELADEIEQAIRLWENHDNGILSNVSQVYKEKQANIKIIFDDLTKENFLHYDGIQGNLVKIDGHTLTFDLSKKWLLKHMSKEINGFRFQEVFLHAYGHVLGLEHSLLPGNIMYPYYEEGVKRLGSQDLHSFNLLYTKDYDNKYSQVNHSQINSGPQNQSNSIGPQKDIYSSYNNKININSANKQGFYEHNTYNESKIGKGSNFSGIKEIKDCSGMNQLDNENMKRQEKWGNNQLHDDDRNQGNKMEKIYEDNDRSMEKKFDDKQQMGLNQNQENSNRSIDKNRDIEMKEMKREENFDNIHEKNSTRDIYNSKTNAFTNKNELFNINEPNKQNEKDDSQFWKNKLENSDNKNNMKNDVEPIRNDNEKQQFGY